MCDITCLTWYCNENRIQEQVRVIYNETFFFLSHGGALINASSFHLSFSILRNLCSCGFRRPFFFLAASMSYTTMYVVLSWWGNAWLPSARLLHMNISVVYQLDAEQEEAWVVTENSYYYYYYVADGHRLVLSCSRAITSLTSCKCPEMLFRWPPRARAAMNDH